MSALSIPPSLREIIAEHDAKLNGGAVTRLGPDGIEEVIAEYPGVEAMIANLNEAVSAIEAASVVRGKYVEPLFGRSSPEVGEGHMRELITRSAWKAIHDGLSIDRIATAKDRQRIERMLQDPPALTIDAVRQEFGDYLLDTRFHILRGLAEAFSDLDPAFKSHEKMKIGVKGLPKRVIIENAMGEYSWGSYGEGKLKDVIRAFLTVRGEPNLTYAEYEGMKKEARRRGEADWPGGKIKAFRNGNAHLMFSAEALREINLALAEFYGDVLPDCPEAAPAKRPGTAVSADLQFYGSPGAVVRRMIELAPPQEGWRILEPSCGDGAILVGLRDYAREAGIGALRLLGIEVHPVRAAAAAAKGFAVQTMNFLDIAPEPEFDAIYMNPPFAGRHYLKHLRRAIDMLKPGGRLVSVLPATAFYDHRELPGRNYDPAQPRMGWYSFWSDLPHASFRSSGTNVATGIWTYTKEAAA